MSSTSSSPEPVQRIKTKKKDSKKKTKSSKAVVPEHGKDEGTNPDWDYVPPEGTILLDHNVDSAEFDWDTVKNDEDVELWLVRVPEGVKPKYLDNLKIDLPSSSRSATVGALHRKHVSYDIWSIGDGEEQCVGGEEIRGLSCLLPRKKKKGKLFQAPKPIARHLVISAQDVIPTASNSTQTYQNPPRQSYPKEVLKHQFTPYGSGTGEDAVSASQDNTMNVDESMEGAETVLDRTQSPVKKLKTKKRKVESETPKKSKRVKVDIE